MNHGVYLTVHCLHSVAVSYLHVVQAVDQRSGPTYNHENSTSQK